MSLGEAALAVAKLLKEQGRWRQVVVVTHNPLVASLADKHFVVSKSTGDGRKNKQDLIEEIRSENYGNADGDLEVDSKYDRGTEVDLDRNMSEKRRRGSLATSNSRSMSALSEVCGEHRELEISRMATGGGVHSAAGLALARALLGSSGSGSGRVTSLD